MRPDGDRVNVLLVDDQPSKLLSYEVILEELGENLIKATSGRQALEQLLRHEVAVILIDVSMPELDGFELATMIRDHPRFTRTAIIFVSAIHLSELDSLRGYQAGAVDYLPVPVVPALLRAKVRIFCDLYRKTRQLESMNEELERRVAERTAELAAANDELERRVESRTREREEALARIAEMQKLESLGQLTGGLAHDFNNLLMVVMSNVEMALKQVGSDERLTRWLGRAMEAAASGAALTKRMLAFARRQDLRPESFSLAEVVNGMVEMMSHSSGRAFGSSSTFPGDLPLVRIDRNQLELALLNLGLNARDAMPSGGEIVIKARDAEGVDPPDGAARGHYVHLSVADTGVGMDAETLKRASEPFFTTKPAGKGSGLGLSMVHGLAFQSGGAMKIMSRPNEGTLVSLWIPAAPVQAQAPETRRGEAPVPTKGFRVLVVDDDPLVLATTSDMLRGLGHDPLGVRSGKQALEILQTDEAPDLAILDYAMPEMTGAALAELIRKARPGLPLLLATGYSERESGCEDLPRLDKPFTIGELARQIGALAASRGVSR